MLDVARQALANAHAPYSRFRVGACLRATSGRLYGGCNVENSAYPVGQCAEATAIGAMVVAGDREIVEVVVLTEGSEICAPCGRCRQQLGEFARPAVPVTSRAPKACASRPRSESSCRSRSAARRSGPRRPDGAAGA
jgi:cytidine deaminase